MPERADSAADNGLDAADFRRISNGGGRGRGTRTRRCTGRRHSHGTQARLPGRARADSESPGADSACLGIVTPSQRLSTRPGQARLAGGHSASECLTVSRVAVTASLSVSLSGPGPARDHGPRPVSLARLSSRCQCSCGQCGSAGVRLSLSPAPGPPATMTRGAAAWARLGPGSQARPGQARYEPAGAAADVRAAAAATVTSACHPQLPGLTEVLETR